VTACQQAGGSAADCLAPEDHLDSIMALDASSGQLRWAVGVQGFDAWNYACVPGLPPNNCSDNPGPDFDFGDGAHLFTIPDGHGGTRLVVGAGQKSGVFWTLDATTGQIICSAAAGPGGAVGGIKWGSATDGQRIYIAEANSTKVPYQLPDGRTITSGSWAALDPATGRNPWQVADPTGGVDTAAVTVANGVLFGSSITGRMFAFNAATGQLLWQFQGEGSSAAGPAVVAGTVYWGNGYTRFEDGPSRTFYAFSIP
jgi:polyvinyl alcohol dehydrogenase (cytochrome)